MENYPNDKHYSTAETTISCASLGEGDCVSVKFSHYGSNGVAWFRIDGNQNGKLSSPIYYPKHHLTRFVF